VWIRSLIRVVLVASLCGPLAARGTARDGSTTDHAEFLSLIEDLRAGNVEVRRTAAARLGMSDRPVQRMALPALIDRLMNEKDGQVRLAVLDAVTALGHDAAPAVPALVHTLRTDAGNRRLEESHQDYRSALALAAVGKPAVEGLRGLLTERKENVRAEAAMGLGRIGPDAEAAVPDLILLLGDKSERIQGEAYLALGRIGTAAVEPLTVAAANPDAQVRTRAVEGLGALSAPDDRASRAVLECAHDAVPEVRTAALKSLPRFELPDAVVLPILKENLRHEDEHVQRAVVNWLVARPALLRQTASELDRLLMGGNDGVSHHAAFLLGKIGPDAAPRLLKALHDERSRIDQIAEALAQIGRPAVGLLTQAVEAPEPRVRRGASLALGQIRPLAPGTVQKLRVGLEDRDPAVRSAFLTAIGSLGPRARESVPSVRSLLRDDSAAIRIQVIDVLSHCAPRDERLVDDLMSLLDDPDAQVQRRTIDAIRSLGPAGIKALPVIIRKLRAADREVRLAAAEMIGSHGRSAADAVPALILMLDDPTPELQTVAAQTLGKLGKAAQPAFEPLTVLLRAEPVKVREAAAATMGSLGVDAEVIRPHLARALRDNESDVRRAAMTAIQRLGPQGSLFVPDLIGLAGRKDTLMSVQRLLRRFERRGPDVRSLPELAKQLEHEQVAVRLLAIKFLGLAGRNAREHVPALERLREDPSNEVREQAKAASEQIKNDSAPSGS
jgi:HEAT repeat protein